MRKKEKNKLKGMDQESRRKLIKKKKGVVKRVSPFMLSHLLQSKRGTGRQLQIYCPVIRTINVI